MKTKKVKLRVHYYYICSVESQRTQDFTDWYDFADFLKEAEVQGKAHIAIVKWEYIH